MNPVRALKAGRCAQCKGPIHRTEMIVRGTADTWVHADCEPDFTPWDEQTRMNRPTEDLARIVAARPNLGAMMLDADFDPGELPVNVADALFKAVAAENVLYTLLCDLASEHIGGR